MTDTSASVPTPVADGAAGERSQPPPSPSAPADDRARPVPSGVDDVPTARSLDLLHGVEMTVTVELGRTKMLLRDLLALQTGSVIELDRPAGSPVDVLINDNLLARGEVVVLDDEFGVRILDIVLADGQPGRH